MLTLAKESGGWSEDYIRLWLPFSRAMQYRHVILRRRGFWTLAPDAAPQTQLAKMRSALGRVLGHILPSR